MAGLTSMQAFELFFLALFAVINFIAFNLKGRPEQPIACPAGRRNFA